MLSTCGRHRELNERSSGCRHICMRQFHSIIIKMKLKRSSTAKPNKAHHHHGTLASYANSRPLKHPHELLGPFDPGEPPDASLGEDLNLRSQLRLVQAEVIHRADTEDALGGLP